MVKWSNAPYIKSSPGLNSAQGLVFVYLFSWYIGFQKGASPMVKWSNAPYIKSSPGLTSSQGLVFVYLFSWYIGFQKGGIPHGQVI